jgi:hypothetical protein
LVSYLTVPRPPSVARWQKFRPESSKGAAEKKSRPKEFVAEFWLILSKSGRKGAAEYFQKKFLIFSCDNHV